MKIKKKPLKRKRLFKKYFFSIAKEQAGQSVYGEYGSLREATFRGYEFFEWLKAGFEITIYDVRRYAWNAPERASSEK